VGGGGGGFWGGGVGLALWDSAVGWDSAGRGAEVDAGDGDGAA
jgi:hypothetical protein